MSDNSYEYIIKQKNKGNVLLKKLSAILAYIIFAAVLCSLSVILPPKELRLFLLLISIAVTALLIFITWRFLCVEYEVIIEGGDLTVTTIYGKLSRKRLFSIPVNAISEIGEYDDRAYDEISKLSLQKDYVCLSSLSAPLVYYAIFDEDKEKCILYFDTTEKAVALLKKLNSGAFRASDRRMNNKQINN